MQAQLQLEFRCPHCDGRDHEIKKNVLTCLGCQAQRTKKEYWKYFTIVRRCVSRLDYEFYLERTPAKP